MSLWNSITSSLNWVGGAANKLGSVGEWGSVFSDGIQDMSNKAENLGAISEVMTGDTTFKEKAKVLADGGADLYFTGRITDTLKSFLPDWMARGLGTILGNLVGNAAGWGAEKLTNMFGGGDEAQTPSAAPAAPNNSRQYAGQDTAIEYAPNHAELVARNSDISLAGVSGKDVSSVSPQPNNMAQVPSTNQVGATG